MFDVDEGAPRLIELDEMVEAFRAMDQSILMTGAGAAAFMEERYAKLQERSSYRRSN
jgi:hypothetical protein